ncbi:thiosulfate/3-mercaptopyruvate sulfurtransferase [Gluconacetobacter liquefaciens]|uniref:Thiosulfate/3-mercaptopyruvate sulfurtransferase n=2 Tax=Gluconacetobacter liquefaciens TaxID=89584 RepID=A0A370FY97_GLULI|nr:sulfurtransferase [Gluconacetobacter liquefaciens]RDI36601.1 thiosulfate/3-mercaptopyruvate sulfurtransferase [Gluconacetobacter liquefaciens]
MGPLSMHASIHPLISPARLRDILSAPDLVLLDATMPLPGETFDPAQRFVEARLPGARRFDIEQFSDPGSPLPHMIPTQARFATLAGELGVSDAAHVVFYDQGNAASAARGWWLARLFGLERVQVLDGGLPAWQRAGGPVDEGAPQAVQAVAFRPTPRFRLVAGLGDMRDHVRHGDRLILDARAHGRFAGEVVEPRPGVVSGHMPGARNLPFGMLLDDHRAFLPPEALRARFAEAGVTEDRRVITSCGSGVTAAVLSLGLAICGRTGDALYDGSWAEWGSTPGAPVETGPGRSAVS